VNTEPDKAAKAKLDFYNQWLADFEQRRKVANRVSQARDLAAWEYGALESAPATFIEIPSQHLPGLYKQEIDYAQGVLPPASPISGTTYEFTAGSATTAASATYNVIRHAATFPDPALQNWSAYHSSEKGLWKSDNCSENSRRI
jgi:hypothetical protein